MASPFSIETQRLRLRAPTLEDVDAVLRIFSDPEAVKFIGTGATRTRDEVLASLEKSIALQERLGHTLWSVERLDSGEVIGDCGLVPMAWKGPEIELGYRFARVHWGQGFATEAARAALDFGFGELEMTEILAVTNVRNDASKHVLRKLGFEDRGLTDRYYDQTTHLFSRQP